MNSQKESANQSLMLSQRDSSGTSDQQFKYMRMKSKFALILISNLLICNILSAQTVSSEFYRDLVINKFNSSDIIIGWSENNLLAYFHIYAPKEAVGQFSKMNIIDVGSNKQIALVPVEDNLSHIYDHINQITKELIKNKIVLFKPDFVSFPGDLNGDTLNYRLDIFDDHVKVVLYLEKSKKTMELLQMSKPNMDRFFVKGFTINPYNNNQMVVFYFMGKGNSFNEISDFDGETFFEIVDLKNFVKWVKPVSGNVTKP
jgi:hypothetical protein